MYISLKEVSIRVVGNVEGPRGEDHPSRAGGNLAESLIGGTGTQTIRSSSTHTQTSLSSPAIYSANTIITRTTSDLAPNQAPTSLNILLAPTSSPLVASDDSGLPRGAIIGITLGSIFIFFLIVLLLDVFLLSSRVRRNFFRSSPDKKDPFAIEKPLIPPRANTIKRKPLPPPDVPLYDKEIKHSRALSLDSASRYSRSTWGWSGENDGTTLRDSGEVELMQKSANYYRYSNSVFEEDAWDEWMEEKGRAYNGAIRPGMGVQKRYTRSSFGTVNQTRYTPSSFALGEVDLDDMDEKVDYSKRRGFPTWILNDPLERWRRGLHPLAGKRGEGFERIAYFK